MTKQQEKEQARLKANEETLEREKARLEAKENEAAVNEVVEDSVSASGSRASLSIAKSISAALIRVAQRGTDGVLPSTLVRNAVVTNSEALGRWTVKKQVLPSTADGIKTLEITGEKSFPVGYYQTSKRWPTCDPRGLSSTRVSADLQNDLVSEVNQIISDSLIVYGYDSTLEALLDIVYRKNSGEVFTSTIGDQVDYVTIQSVLQQYLAIFGVLGNRSVLLDTNLLSVDSQDTLLERFIQKLQLGFEITSAEGSDANARYSARAESKVGFMQRRPAFPIAKKKGLRNVEIAASAQLKMAENLYLYFLNQIRRGELLSRPGMDLDRHSQPRPNIVRSKGPVIKEIRVRFTNSKILGSTVVEAITAKVDKESTLPLNVLSKGYTQDEAIEAILIGNSLLLTVNLPQYVTEGHPGYELARLESWLSDSGPESKTNALQGKSLAGLLASSIATEVDKFPDFRRHVVVTPDWTTFTWDENRRCLYFQSQKRSVSRDNRNLRSANSYSLFTASGAASVCLGLSCVHAYPAALIRDLKEQGSSTGSVGSVIDRLLRDDKDSVSMALAGHPALNRLNQFVSFHWMDLLLICYSDRFRDLFQSGKYSKSVTLSVKEMEDILTSEYLKASETNGWLEGADPTNGTNVFLGKLVS